jgi:hypothetical protein
VCITYIFDFFAKYNAKNHMKFDFDFDFNL